ncbi:MAG TPA: zinc-binding dehydrogenase [Hyphomonas sp.]|nr:zinc-binding dehydrogenase [Hyphomonas sp.]
MRAAVLQGHAITVEDMPDPVPARGQLLVRPLMTGICGSDLSLRKQMTALEQGLEVEARAGLPKIVPGHEFCAELVEAGPGTETALRPGARLTAVPFTHGHAGPETIGLSPVFSGGLATLCLVDAERTFAVPDGMPADLAALTEPLAVGAHAVNVATRNRAPNVVIGCGPVGLAVILSLRLQGRGPILAADFSAQRRARAAELGADIVVDPAESSPYERWGDLGFKPALMSPLLERELRERPKGCNIFECSGAPGVLGQIIASAPGHAHIIVVGVCPHEEKVTPLEGILRELTVDFSFAYRPAEFTESLAMIAAHPDLAARLITSRLPLAETEDAFDRLSSNPDEVKILITPQH